ncbi:secondary thiamine-phosphate synthase enzyme YjbQ [Clostridium sp. C8-1-8]|uniref:secondary thiamine-phosphate synthase enzyme YjbQ n=1 Tax=Clostridium sp. C8-1-8 TaxID=2698831 RepID=UPI00136A559E|nr:secondary thiamine-phosphate synthase enzyme YjbQ [Clostridium sp. C8-1-8]
MVVYESFTLLTKDYNQLIVLTDKISEVVLKSGIKNGIVVVITKHTTTGITVNESLECLENDIQTFLERLIPEDFPYTHARMLRSYGSTAGNPTGHLKAHITSNNCIFSIVNGEIVKGDAQDIYFCEFDGPARRTVSVSIIGE